MIYTDEQLRLMQKAELEILETSDLFFRQFKLTYSLMYGTLLGAVRHKGFIPWDDDVDIAMPRQDYERFLLLSKKFPGNFEVINTDINHKFPFPHTQIMKKNTLAVMASTAPLPIPHGIFLDVYPFDICDDENKIARTLKHRNKWLSIQLRHILPYGTPFFGGGINNGAKTFLSKALPLSFILRVSRRGISIENKGRFFVQFDNYEHGGGHLFSSTLFDSLIELPFEGHLFFCTNQYDAVLKELYGDYMTLPPVSDRVGHHFYLALKF